MGDHDGFYTQMERYSRLVPLRVHPRPIPHRYPHGVHGTVATSAPAREHQTATPIPQLLFRNPKPATPIPQPATRNQPTTRSLVRHELEVVLGDISVPVLLQPFQAGVLAQDLAVCPLPPVSPFGTPHCAEDVPA